MIIYHEKKMQWNFVYDYYSFIILIFVRYKCVTLSTIACAGFTISDSCDSVHWW